MEFVNRHCRCALIVGPVREVEGRCGRGECGRDPEFRDKVAEEEERSERDGRGHGVDAEEEREEKKVGM